MAALTKTDIIGRIADANDISPANAEIRFTLNSFDTDASKDVTVSTSTVIAPIDAGGDIATSLWANESGVRETRYAVHLAIMQAETDDFVTFLGYITVPVSVTALDLNDLLPISVLNPPNPSIQDLLDEKAPKANPTFTGTVSGVTKAHVGLGSVDNTSDVNKPISSATQTALDGKAATDEVIQADDGARFYIATRTSPTDVIAYVNGPDLVVGWEQLSVQTPYGVRNIASRSPAILPAGQILYIDLLAAYSSSYPVVQAAGSPAFYDDQARGEILIIVHRNTARVMGALAGEIQRRIDVTTPNALAGYQANGVENLHTSPRNWLTGRAPKVIPHTGWFILQPAVLGSAYRFTSATAVVDLDHFPDGAECTIEVLAGGKLFCAFGFAGEVGNEMTFTAKSYVRLGRMVDDGPMLVEFISAVARTMATITKPAMDRTILLVGQSQLDLGHRHGRIGGFAEEMATGDLSGIASNESFHFINTAVSGSAMDSRSTAGANYWWDAGLDAPGPLLIDAVADIAASTGSGQPAPDVVLFAQGEADTKAIDNGTINRADWRASVSSVATHIRSNGAAGSDWLMFPPGSNDLAYYFEGMNGIRAEYRVLTDGVAYMHYGHEMYDVHRQFQNVHPTDQGFQVLGMRDALVYKNVIDGATLDLGPVVGAATADAAATTITVAIDGATALSAPSQGYEPGPYPFGMHIVIGDPVSGTVVPIISGTASNIGVGPAGSVVVTLYTAAPATGGTLYTVPGQFPSVWKRGYIRDNTLHGNSLGLPLRYQRVTIT